MIMDNNVYEKEHEKKRVKDDDLNNENKDTN